MLKIAFINNYQATLGELREFMELTQGNPDDRRIYVGDNMIEAEYAPEEVGNSSGPHYHFEGGMPSVADFVKEVDHRMGSSSNAHYHLAADGTVTNPSVSDYVNESERRMRRERE